MSRFAGLPRRMSSDHDRLVATLSSTRHLPAHARLLRAVSGSILHLILLLMIAASALPVSHAQAVAAPAASFAVAGLIGASGDSPVTANSAGQDAIEGTLSFGDRTDLPPVLPLDPMTPITPTDTVTPSVPPPTPTTAPTAPADPTVAPATPTPDPSDDGATDQVAARGLRVAQVARKYVGYPYRYGAAGPRAFDCSGLTLYIYRQFGIALPHKARAQYSERYGRRISSMSSLLPGDLVFFRNTAGPGITHAAVYVGNGLIVTANTPRLGVQISSLTSSYWRRHFAGGIRPGL